MIADSHYSMHDFVVPFTIQLCNIICATILVFLFEYLGGMEQMVVCIVSIWEKIKHSKTGVL